MTVISQVTKEKAKITVLKSLPLTKEGSEMTPVPRRAATAQPLNYRISSLHPEGIGRASPMNSMPLSTIRETSALDLSQFKSWARDAIKDQQKDIDRVSGTLLRIEAQMQAFRTFMEETRTELAASRDTQHNLIQDGEELTNVQLDLEKIHKKIETLENTEQARGKSGESIGRDIEIIVSDMQRISNKANEVDDLRNGLREVKNRIKGSLGAGAAMGNPDQNGNEIDDLKTEIQQLKQRLEFTECAVQNVPAIENSQLTKSDQKAIQTDSRERQPERSPTAVEISVHETPTFREHKGPSLKRKHREAQSSASLDADEDELQPSLPAKRTRPSKTAAVETPSKSAPESTSSPSQVRFQEQEVIEIFSSERGESPLLGQHEDVEVPNHGENRAVNNPKPATKGSSKNLTTSSQKTSGGGRWKTSLRKTVSANNLAAWKERMASIPSPLQKPLEDQKRRSSMTEGPPRDSTGAIITPSGKVDGRSLRYRKRDNEEMVSSIEREDDPLEKPYKCDSCGKRYAKLSGLSSVSLIASFI